ncbi:MAG: type I methionyl aminopeptidase [Rivularia sp. (in: cyanobacteria)]
MNNQNLLSIAGIKPQSKKGLVLLSARELDKMRRVGKLAANLLNHLEGMVQPGISTKDLDDEAARFMKANGAISATLGYAPPNHQPYTGSVCTSVNEVVCHGIPNSKTILKDGDIINIDVTPILDGFHGDTSRTFLVGNVSDKAQKLVEVTRESMMRGIAQVKPGGRIGDIGAAIQEYAEANGFSVVRDMVGHGVGREFHTEPQVPHYGTQGTGIKLRKGMVFTIEPMLNEGTYELKFLKDGWTVITQDGKLSAQFEHTIAVTDDGFEILTLA